MSREILHNASVDSPGIPARLGTAVQNIIRRNPTEPSLTQSDQPENGSTKHRGLLRRVGVNISAAILAGSSLGMGSNVGIGSSLSRTDIPVAFASSEHANQRQISALLHTLDYPPKQASHYKLKEEAIAPGLPKEKSLVFKGHRIDAQQIKDPDGKKAWIRGEYYPSQETSSQYRPGVILDGISDSNAMQRLQFTDGVAANGHPAGADVVMDAFLTAAAHQKGIDVATLQQQIAADGGILKGLLLPQFAGTTTISIPGDNNYVTPLVKVVATDVKMTVPFRLDWRTNSKAGLGNVDPNATMSLGDSRVSSGIFVVNGQLRYVSTYTSSGTTNFIGDGSEQAFDLATFLESIGHLSPDFSDNPKKPLMNSLAFALGTQYQSGATIISRNDFLSTDASGNQITYSLLKVA